MNPTTLVALLSLLQSAPGTDPAAPRVDLTTTVVGRAIDADSVTRTVISQEQIVALGASSLADILTIVPGLELAGPDYRGAERTAQIRGGDPNFTLVLVDGVPVNDPTDAQGGTFNLASIPASAIASVTVVRGALSSYLGSTGLGGVIEVRTRAAAVASSSGADATGAASGSFELETGAGAMARTAGGLALGHGSTRLGLTVHHERERDRIGDDAFTATDLHAHLATSLFAHPLRATYRLSDATTADYPDASGGPVLGSGDLREQDTTSHSLGVRLDLGTDLRLRHTLSTTYTLRTVDGTSPAIGFAVPAQSTATDYDRTRLGYHLRASAGKFTVLEAGAEFERESADAATTLHLPAAFGGDTPGNYTTTRHTAALYTSGTIRRGPAQLEFGARLDRPEDHTAEFSPRLGLSVTPGQAHTRLSASVGRAFKLPSLFALESPPALGGNPDLVPETAIGADLGLTHRFDTLAAEVTATAFLNRFADLIDFDFDTFRHVNRSKVESEGLELSGQLAPHPSLHLQASATWTDTRDGSGATLLHHPRWHGAARVGWTPREAIDLDLAVRWRGGIEDRQIPVPERTGVDGYGVLDLGLRLRPATGWELFVRIDNATNEGYESLIGFEGPGRGMRAGVRVQVD